MQSKTVVTRRSILKAGAAGACVPFLTPARAAVELRLTHPADLSQTRLGAIDMILMNPANIEAISKSIGVINIPYQFDSYAHAHRTLDVSARDWIEQQLAAAGFSWIA